MNKYTVNITPGSGNYLYIDDPASERWEDGSWCVIEQRMNNEFRVALNYGSGGTHSFTTYRIDQAFEWAGKWITKGVLPNA